MKLPFHTILCPTDLSETGNLAIDVAYRLAGEGSVVHLLHVAEPPYLGNPMYSQYVQGYVPTPEEQEAGEERVRNKLRHLTPENALTEGVRTEHHLEHSVNVSDTIEEKAEEIGADVIIMGTHGRGRASAGS
ncbi:MAG: universal stress protein [Planctomycetota bacterium]|jgi:nucleotide-binding universal stress UspA family protein